MGDFFNWLFGNSQDEQQMVNNYDAAGSNAHEGLSAEAKPADANSSMDELKKIGTNQVNGLLSPYTNALADTKNFYNQVAGGNGLLGTSQAAPQSALGSIASMMKSGGMLDATQPDNLSVNPPTSNLGFGGASPMMFQRPLSIPNVQPQMSNLARQAYGPYFQ